MSIGCNYTNILEQELFRIRKDADVDITQLTATVYMPHVHEYEILTEGYEEGVEVEVQNPCNPNDPTDKIKVKANLKKIIVVADVHYNILLVTSDKEPDVYDGEMNHKMVFDIYEIVSVNQPVPDTLNITPKFTISEPIRVIVENEDEVDFYTFVVNGTVDLEYS